jgi:ADP-heptose:LPS heptosyltransferase
MSKRVLIIRFSSIGDIVLTTPVIRCVKEQLGAEVHVLTKEAYAPTLAGNPNIDRLIAIRERISEVIDELRSHQYDWIADLHHNLRSARVKSALRRPGAAFPKLNVEKWLLTNLKINRLPDKHIVDRYFEAVADLGVKNDGKGLDFFIPEDAVVDIGALTGPSESNSSFIAMAIGAGLNTKNLEDEQWLRLIDKFERKIILLGGPGDAGRGQWLAERADNCINLAGKLSLPQSASVIAQSGVLVTPDTGLMHIAAALKKPIVSIWGNTIPGFGMTPYYPEGTADREVRIEINGLSCRPCSKIGYDACPKGHFKCIRNLDMDTIVSAASRFIAI